MSWLYSYIYKKRFGFIFCKKFAKSASASSLPYKFMAFSQAFKNLAFIQVSNGPKVVLLNAGENKRSIGYSSSLPKSIAYESVIVERSEYPA